MRPKCAHNDCADDAACHVQTEVCGNGADGDGDGIADCAARIAPQR